MLSFIAFISEICMLSLLHLLGYGGDSDAVSFVFISFFSFLYFYDVSKKYAHRAETWPLIFGYLLRVATLLFDLYGKGIYSLPNSGADSEMYYRLAIRFADRSKIPFDRNGFSAVMAVFVKLVGASRLYLQFIVMLFSVITLHTAAQIMRELKIDSRARRKALYMIALLPNFAILSSIFLRESIVTMLISRGILHLVRWMKRKKNSELLISGACIVASSYFHGGSIGILIGFVILLLLYDNKTDTLRLTFKSLFLSAIMLFVLVFLYTRFGDILFTKLSNLEKIDDIANTAQRGGSTYGAYAGDSSSIPRMVLFTPIRILLFLYSPFFWQIRGLSDIIALCFDSAFYIYVTLLFSKSLRRASKNRKAELLTLMIIAFATAFVFGWGVSNVGTAIRHRDKLIIVWIVMYALEKDVEAGIRRSRVVRLK